MQPTVKPLSVWRRKLVFGTLLAVFLICLPASIFYAAGYRYDFNSMTPVFTVTGGFYILADAVDSVIYIDNEEVTNARAFRDAFYIQGLEPGTHRVHVQGEGLHTWVKELTIYPHIVTEVESFNLPLVPQVRLITEYTNEANNLGVVFAKSSSTPVLSLASSTTNFVVATSSATTTLRANAEFALLDSLFIENASNSLALKEKEIVTDTFGFATTTSRSLATTSATTTVIRETLMLYEEDGEVYLRTLSANRKDIPRYFCTEQNDLEKILVDKEVALSETIPSETSLSNLAGDQLLPCRPFIKMDRRGQKVQAFDFFPADTNLVLMHLEDGIYVVEADDRAWQNGQILFPGRDLEMLIYRGGIFIKENGLIFEAIPEIVRP